MSRKETLRLARKLVALSKGDDGRLCAAKAGEVLEALRQQPPSGYRALLKEYYRQAARERRRYTALVECAGALGDSEQGGLRDFLDRHYGRSIDLELRDNPSLIAGLRVRIGDDVWERSVASSLERLRQVA